MKERKLSSWTEEELLRYCQGLYGEHGIEALTYSFLRQHRNIYYVLYHRQIRPKQLASKLGLSEEYDAHLESRNIVRKGNPQKRWTWNRIIAEAEEVQKGQGFLPPAAWFQANGYGTLVQAVYYLGHTWEQLREKLDDFSGSQFVQSRNGMRWRSHPEASFSNFLYARGITHRKGERYPDEYAVATGRAYGLYDVHIEMQDGWIDVEIWGDKPNGHGEREYAEKRLEKENFNSSNPNFLGIEYSDCFDDERLKALLSPYLAILEPYVFDQPSDPHIESSHWSNADELLVFCKQLAAQMPDGKFPTEEWLRKRGKWADRDGPAYNTVSVYIKTWLGGVRNLRKILGQEHYSTNQWDRESAIRAWKDFCQKTGATPGRVRSAVRRGSSEYSDEQAREASVIDAAVLKYAGGSETVNEILGVETERSRKWTREAILRVYKDAFAKWGMAPSQITYEHRKGRVHLSHSEYRTLCQAIDAAGRTFSSAQEVYEEVGLFPPRRHRKRNRR